MDWIDAYASTNYKDKKLIDIQVQPQVVTATSQSDIPFYLTYLR